MEAVKSIHPKILVEREVGCVGSGSEIHDKRPDSIRLTEPKEAREFVAETKVDWLLPSVGTMRGKLASGESPGEPGSSRRWGTTRSLWAV